MSGHDLDALRERMEALDVDVDELASSLADLLKGHGQLEESIERLAGVLESQGAPGGTTPKSAGAAGAGGAEPGAVPPWWVRSATREDWAELAEWVDDLASTFELDRRELRPCWPAHPAAVEDLAAARTAWAAAHENDEICMWIERVLRPTLDRLESMWTRFCNNEHKAPQPAPATDTQLLTTALQGAPERPSEDEAGHDGHGGHEAELDDQQDAQAS